MQALHTMRPPLLGSFAIAIALGSPAAHAQTGDDTRARADQLFRDGQQLMGEGQVSAACVKLEESQHLDPKLGRLLNVAYCHEQAGRIASAWSEYNQAAALASQTGQAERETFARTQAGELALKLSFLRVDLAASPHVSDVTVDGKALSRDQWAVPFPIDPGPHVLTFAGARRKTRTQAVTVSGPGTLRLVVDPLAPEASSAPATPGAPAAAAGETRPGGGGRALGWILGGVGLAALGAGTGFALHAMSLKSDADPDCPNHLCTPAGKALIDNATTWATLADVGFAVGVAGLGVGTWLLVRAASTKGTSAQIAPYVFSDRAGIACQAVW